MKTSAGLLVYRRKNGQIEALIAHMGGPWFGGKDKGAWSIPKGEYGKDQEPLKTAFKEFEEELGKEPPEGDLIELGKVKQSNNKEVIAWALEGDLDVSQTRSNFFEAEWPPRSGVIKKYPEIDRAEWASLDVAAARLVTAQVEFLERLAKILGVSFKAKPEPQQSSLL